MNYIVLTLGSKAWKNKTNLINLKLRDELFYSSKTQSPGMNFKISKLVYIFATLLALALPPDKLFFIHYDIFQHPSVYVGTILYLFCQFESV